MDIFRKPRRFNRLITLKTLGSCAFIYLIFAGLPAPIYADITRCELAIEDARRVAPAELEGAENISDLDDLDISSNEEEDVGFFRQAAASFAPEILLRVWWRDELKERRQRQSTELANMAASTPHRRIDQQFAPFGWQITLRWNLVEIAESLWSDPRDETNLFIDDCLLLDPFSEALVESSSASNYADYAQGIGGLR